MFAFDVRLVPRSVEPWGRGTLSLLAGYLCCLSTFEWSHLWAFSPFLFRPGATLFLTLSFLVCLGMHGIRKEQRAATAMVGVCWVAVTTWPLRMSPVVATVIFSALALAVLVSATTGPRAVLGLALALMLALTLLSGFWPWPVTAILLITALVEMLRGKVRLAPASTSSREARARLAADANSRSVDITWKGLAALSKATQPGEGEKFTTRVLADTAQILESSGGRRVRGSDLNGTYRFANEDALERCMSQLKRYEVSIREVLIGVGAPPLTLVTSRHEVAVNSSL